MAFRPIQGTFEECLNHYRRYGGDHSFKRMRTFNVSTNEGTLRRWFVDSAPNGVYRIRLQQYLLDLGYKIKELNGVSEEIRLACQLLSYDLATENEIASGFGIPEHRWSRLPNMLVRGSMADERIAKGRTYLAPLKALIAETHEGRILALTGSVPAKAPKNDPVPTPPTAPAVPAVPTSSAPPPHLITDHDAVIQATAAMLTSVYPLLQLVNSDQYSPEERKALRAKLGFFGAMSISTELNRLCSERAREQFNSEGNGK